MYVHFIINRTTIVICICIAHPFFFSSSSSHKDVIDESTDLDSSVSCLSYHCMYSSLIVSYSFSYILICYFQHEIYRFVMRKEKEIIRTYKFRYRFLYICVLNQVSCICKYRFRIIEV